MDGLSILFQLRLELGKRHETQSEGEENMNVKTIFKRIRFIFDIFGGTNALRLITNIFVRLCCAAHCRAASCEHEFQSNESGERGRATTAPLPSSPIVESRVNAVQMICIECL